MAARELDLESVVFSLNYLVFGRSSCLAVLQDYQKEPKPPQKLLSYVNGFMHRLERNLHAHKRKLSIFTAVLSHLYCVQHTVKSRKKPVSTSTHGRLYLPSSSASAKVFGRRH